MHSSEPPAQSEPQARSRLDDAPPKRPPGVPDDAPPKRPPGVPDDAPPKRPPGVPDDAPPKRPPGVPYVPAHALPPGIGRGLPTGAVIGIALGVVALLVVCGGIAVAGLFLLRRDDDSGQDGPLSEVVDYRTDKPEALSRDHKLGRIEYPMTPPAGGPHNAAWQNCEGDVYRAPIANENAVHSLEHGAVWITYAPALSADQVEILADKVRGRNYLFMSPYPDQDRAIALQAWGYQLKVDTASDVGVDEFIAKYRQSATMEPGGPCGLGVTATGTAPKTPR